MSSTAIEQQLLEHAVLRVYGRLEPQEVVGLYTLANRIGHGEWELDDIKHAVVDLCARDQIVALVGHGALVVVGQ